MTVSASQKETTDLVLVDLIDAVTRKLQAGEPVDLETYATEYPDHAGELQKLLPALELLATLPAAGRQPGGSSPALADRPAADDASRPLQGMVGEYRVLRELGRGGMGVVYEAEQTSLGRRVALKIFPFAAALDPRRLQRFQNEARAAASLDHPNIVHVHSVGCDRGVHYYAMQYVEGQTLAEVIQQGRGERDEGRGERVTGRRGDKVTAPTPTNSPPHPVTPSPRHAAETSPLAALSTEGSTRSPEFFRSVAQLGIQAAEALEHAHQMGVVHRDIKPSNLMVESRLPSPAGRGAGGEGRGAEAPHLWITDFGLAMTQTDTNLTMTGDLLGTLRYMSPEQLRAEHGVLDHRTDVYSLGLTLYELLTLQPAFPGDDRQKLIRQVAEDEPRRPRQLNTAIPEDLETIVLRAIAKEPEARYGTAQELAEDLRRFMEDKPIQARRPALATRAVKWARRHRPLVWSAAGTLGMVIIGLAISSVLVWRARQEAVGQRDEAREQQQRAEANFLLAQQVVADMYRVAANRLQGKGDLSAARELYEKAAAFYEVALHQKANDPAIQQEAHCAFRNLAFTQFLMGEFEEAERGYRRALAAQKELVREFPTNHEYQYQLCRIQYHLGRILQAQGRPEEAQDRYQKAAEHCERARELAPKHDPEIDAFLVKVYQTNGQYDKAIAISTQRIRLSPENASAYSDRGNAYLRSGKPDKAIGDYTQAVRLDPSRSGAYANRGWAYGAKREYEQAVADFTKSLEVAPGPSFAVLQARGDCYNTMGEFDKAIADFTKAIRLNAKKPTTYYLRAFAYSEKGEFDRAIADCNEAIRLDAKCYCAYHYRGNAYRNKGELDKAIANWTEAIRNDRTRAASYYESRAGLYGAKGEFDKALADRNKSVELHPTNPLPCNGLAWFLVTCPDSRLRDPDRAVELAKKAVELAPKAGAFWNTLGVAHYRAGNWEGAVEVLEKSLELPWGDAFDWFFLAMAHWQLGNKDRACELYEKAVAWIEKNNPKDEQLRRFRTEAAELLGVTETPPTEEENNVEQSEGVPGNREHQP